MISSRKQRVTLKGKIMKIRLKMQEVRNSAVLFAIQIDGQVFQAAINPIELDRAIRLRPCDDFSVIDACGDYNYGVTMDRTAIGLLDAESGLRSLVTEHMKGYYNKLVARKERTAKQERIGIVLDTASWKYSYLRTAKDLLQPVVLL
jgi:hypothetical protein